LNNTRHNPFAGALVAATLLTAFAPVAAKAEAKPFVLASGGRAQAVVVAHGGDTNGIGYAAQQLAKNLGRLSGATFMVADKPVAGYKTILVGAPYKAAKRQETCVRVKDENTLEVTGDGAIGTAYAAADLAETLGIVFCAHDYVYAPPRNELSLPGDYAKVDAPCMTWREAGCEVQFQGHFDHAMNLRIVPSRGDRRWKWFDPTRGENIGQTVCTHYVPRKKFAVAHPDWYAYVAATKQRNFHWVCVSNEGMLNQLYGEIDAELAKDPTIREISVGIDDAYTYCECEKCQELSKRYADPDGSTHPALQCIVLANKVGDHFAMKYPNVRFNFLGYLGFGDSLPTTTDLAFSPNVGAGVAELWRNHGLPANCNERSDIFFGRLARMSSEKNGLYVWDYLANFSDFCIPFPNHRIFGQTAKFYKESGVRGVFCQSQYATTIGDMGALNLWLFAKLLWNPDLDVDTLTATYVKAAYGNGAKGIQEYLDLLEHARLRQRWTWLSCYVADTSHYLTGDDCVKLLRALDNAWIAGRGRRESLMLRRTRIAGYDMALQRYNDMIEPAQRLRYKLMPRGEMLRQWQSLVEGETSRGAYGELGEGRMLGTYENIFKQSFASPAEPTVYPRRSAVIVAPAAKLTGGKRMTRGKDSDGTEYCRFQVNLGGETESVWMNPGFAEIGYSIEDADAGWWYVFATVRTAASVDIDPAVSYLGIYQPWYVNDYKAAGGQEIANQGIQGRKGDVGWKTLCVGKRRLYKGSRVWVMPGILHPSDWCDVREIRLVAPALIETGVADPKDAKARARAVVVGCEKFGKDRNVQIQDDRVDNFKYARLAGFATNAPVRSIVWIVPADLAGEWEVLLDLRSGASIPLDQEAAVAYVTNGATCTDCSALQRYSLRHVTGSLGDESWQIVGLGRVNLEAGMKVVIEPGANTNALPRYTDLRRIVLLDPAYAGKTQPALPMP
jgi:hypothetical protein